MAKQKHTMEEIDRMEELLLEYLGEAGLLDALIRAMDYGEKDENYSYIMQMHDIRMDDEELQGRRVKAPSRKKTVKRSRPKTRKPAPILNIGGMF